MIFSYSVENFSFPIGGNTSMRSSRSIFILSMASVTTRNMFIIRFLCCIIIFKVLKIVLIQKVLLLLHQLKLSSPGKIALKTPLLEETLTLGPSSSPPRTLLPAPLPPQQFQLPNRLKVTVCRPRRTTASLLTQQR